MLGLLSLSSCDSREDATRLYDVEAATLYYPGSELLSRQDEDEELSGFAPGAGRFESAFIQSSLRSSAELSEIFDWYSAELTERGWRETYIDRARFSRAVWKDGARLQIILTAIPQEGVDSASRFTYTLYKTPEECDGELECAQ